jgi:hypothetical protein
MWDQSPVSQATDGNLGHSLIINALCCALQIRSLGAIADRALLVVRPGQISLVDKSFISGTVVSSNFYGGSSLLFIDCGLNQLIKVSSALDNLPQVGTIWDLSWSVDDVLLLAD